jgi:hypothetical protein
MYLMDYTRNNSHLQTTGRGGITGFHTKIWRSGFSFTQTVWERRVGAARLLVWPGQKKIAGRERRGVFTFGASNPPFWNFLSAFTYCSGQCFCHNWLVITGVCALYQDKTKTHHGGWFGLVSSIRGVSSILLLSFRYQCEGNNGQEWYSALHGLTRFDKDGRDATRSSRLASGHHLP